MNLDLSKLDLVKREHDFIIFLEDKPLKTRLGNEFSHPTSRLLKHILTDLYIRKDDSLIRPYYLYEYQKDYLDHKKDTMIQYLYDFLSVDPFVELKTGTTWKDGPKVEQNDIIDQIQPAAINFSFWMFSEILHEINEFFEENIKQYEFSDESIHPFLILLKELYGRITSEQKSSLHFLSLSHRSGLLLPLLLTLGKLTPAEYAKAMIALKVRVKSQFVDYIPASGNFPYQALIPDLPLNDNNRLFTMFYQDASTVADYLSLLLQPAQVSQNLARLIKTGESEQLEFKSTLRWELKAGRTSQQVERASLKTISAFLNSGGGTLLIGVRDDGSIEGIESDRFPNDDRFLLHLWNLIKTSFGKDISPYIQTKLEKIQEKTVCVVTCRKSIRPVFLQQPGFPEEYLIRVGPSSGILAVSEALQYIADHFPDK